MVVFLHGEVSAPHSSSAQKEQSSLEMEQKKSYETTASYYGGEKGSDFHGKKMANGEKFNKNDPAIAASNTLPLGTVIKVTNLDNQKSQKMVVKDTGGFDRYGRGLDVSRAAAQRLGFIKDGLARVHVEIISVPSSS